MRFIDKTNHIINKLTVLVWCFFDIWDFSSNYFTFFKHMFANLMPLRSFVGWWISCFGGATVQLNFESFLCSYFFFKWMRKENKFRESTVYFQFEKRRERSEKKKKKTISCFQICNALRELIKLTLTLKLWQDTSN